MRVFRALAPLVCLVALVFGPNSTQTVSKQPHSGARPGPMDVLVAKRGNAHYSYGTSRPQRLALTANVAPSATFVVSYTGFDTDSRAAFQAAVDIWSHTIVSPVPIRVNARFDSLGNTGILGTAGPTQVCPSPFGASNTLYAAALADALNGSGSCASSSSSEITASFNKDFTNWDFGTSGTGVTNEYNFMTVVLHELGHGLGFYGSMGAEPNGSQGSFSNPPDIYDRFAISGDGMPLLGFTNPSAALGAQLISDNTFWNGPRAVANHGSNPKLETHDFTVWDEPDAFRDGSSYSHVDEDLYSLTPNGLMTWALEAAEVYTDPGPIMRGMMEDEGWTILGAPCAYGLLPTSTTVAATGGSGTVALNAGAGSSCAWSAASNSPFITLTGTVSGTGSANISYTVAPNAGASQRTGTLTIGGRTLTVTQSGTGPTMTLDRDTLNFGAATNGAAFITKTGAQAVRLTQSGPAGTVTWTASSNRPWLTVTPASGSGTATLTVGVKFATGLVATQPGTITLTFTGAGNSAGPVDVTLNVKQSGTTVLPFGSFDTPVNNSMGVAGSIALTGWALDDMEVTRVRVLRDAVTGETPGALIPIGTAVLVDGARPDVGTLYPTYPLFNRAGWGYLLLTNMLPNQGNGTFRLSAYADDPDGHTRLLGSKTITCTNSTATAPFGAIDSPQQGEVVSGSVNNFGWVLARGAVHADPPGGGTVTVYIDGVPVGVPTLWTSRSDLSALFPTGFTDLTSTLAVFTFDSTALANGTHTIAWGVTAGNGQGAGIGSRYFTVSNGASLVAGNRANNQSKGRSLVVGPSGPNASAALTAGIAATPVSRASLTGRTGWATEAPYRTYTADSKGRVVVDGEELGSFDLRPGTADAWFGLAVPSGGTYAGYLRAGDVLGPLPVGSHLDPDTGAFTWQPGVGFTGPYNFVFSQCPASVKARGAMAAGCVRQEVRVVLHPKGSNRVGPQVTIDVPAADARVPGRFLVAGWAIDLDDTVGTGVDALHVWAYPRSACGGSGACSVPPIFLGATAYGGNRPDVGAIYGDRFSASGYGLVVDGLEPGTYDIAVFAWSTARGGFVPAKTVKVIVP